MPTFPEVAEIRPIAPSNSSELINLAFSINQFQLPIALSYRPRGADITTAGHVVVLIGQRRNGGKCEILVSDSIPRSDNEKHIREFSDPMTYWVDPAAFLETHAVDGVSYFKGPLGWYVDRRLKKFPFLLYHFL
jgi:hypothetical protein